MVKHNSAILCLQTMCHTIKMGQIRNT